MSNVIDMQDITKTFGTNTALNHVNFTCNEGEVISLLGENGAGKSTLMKILYGMYEKTDGQIFYKGQQVNFDNPKDAKTIGIQMVHQHFMLVENMSVVDNIMLGKETGGKFFYDREEGRKTVKELGETYGLQVPYDKKIEDISVGERQRVEILKAIYQGGEILILDEPTATLTPDEVKALFAVIGRLRDMGRTIILITHKLNETMAIADRVYVLRQGEMVGERLVSETSINELSEMMVGHRVVQTKRKAIDNDQVMFSAKNVTYTNDDGVNVLKGIDFDIHHQQIVGVASVEGNGQTELINSIIGLINTWDGDMAVDGNSLKGLSVNDIIKTGVSCIHSDRQTYNIAESLDVPYNFLMGNQNDASLYKNNYLVDWEAVAVRSEALMESHDVRPRNIKQVLGDFSGGNQQKFVVGRETEKQPKFIIAAYPTRGVDIMASSFIHDQLTQLKEHGSAVLFFSSDIDELVSISDRLVVLYDGKIVADRKTEDFTTIELGKLMGGGTQ